MNSCSSRKREDEGHLNELPDSPPAHFGGIEPHSIECFAHGGLEKNVVRADESYAGRLDAASFADHEERDDLAFDAGSSKAVGIAWRARAVSEGHLSFNLFRREGFR